MTQQRDVIIIGAGPTGLFSVFECGMMGLKCHVIDALDMVGGQCSALYPEKPIYDIPAYPQITGQELTDKLKTQAAPFDPLYHLGAQVISVEKEEDNLWSVKTSKNELLQAKAIIIAAGVGAFGPKRPPLENLEAYEASGAVQYFVSSREAFRDKTIVIAGGGDSALDWTMSLSELAKKVILVHRRDKFRAAPDSLEKVKALAETGKVEMAIPYQLGRLEGNTQTGALSHVVLNHMDGSEKPVEADVLLPFFGLETKLGPIAEWGLNLYKNQIEVNQQTSETSIPGIFAVGDIGHYPGKLKLILTGFAEAAQAAHKIREICFPGQAFHFEYSTTKGVPDEGQAPLAQKAS